MTINSVAGFNAIHDQDQAVRRLTGLLNTGNIPHALLFSGLDGVGKKKAALIFASALNCSDTGKNRADADAPTPCGMCRQCKKIASGNHPDVLVVQPQKSRIRVQQIRELGSMLAVKPYEAKQRVVIIDQARAMNPAAANSLLKVLEEPPDRTLLILTTGNTYDLLPTVVSRCQHIRFNPISENTLVEFLEKKGVLRDKAVILARAANGSYTKAAALSDTGWVGKRKWIIEMIEPQYTDGAPNRQVGALLAFAEKLSRDKEALADTLEIIKSWFRDLTVVRNGSGRVVNLDLLDGLKRGAAHGHTASFLAKIEAVESAQKKIEANANPRLTLDVLMMKLCI